MRTLLYIIYINNGLHKNMQKKRAYKEKGRHKVHIHYIKNLLKLRTMLTAFGRVKFKRWIDDILWHRSHQDLHFSCF